MFIVVMSKSGGNICHIHLCQKKELWPIINNIPYDSKLLFGDDISKRLNEVNGTTKLKSGKHRRMPKAKNAYRFPKTPGNQKTYGYQQGQKYPKKPFYQTKKHKKQ